jgi:hypothetical protein
MQLATIGRTTFQGDKVFVSLAGLAAWSGSLVNGSWDPQYSTVPPEDLRHLEQQLFTLESGDLSSIRYPYTFSNSLPFNYAVSRIAGFVTKIYIA